MTIHMREVGRRRGQHERGVKKEGRRRGEGRGGQEERRRREKGEEGEEAFLPSSASGLEWMDDPGAPIDYEAALADAEAKAAADSLLPSFHYPVLDLDLEEGERKRIGDGGDLSSSSSSSSSSEEGEEEAAGKTNIFLDFPQSKKTWGFAHEKALEILLTRYPEANFMVLVSAPGGLCVCVCVYV